MSEPAAPTHPAAAPQPHPHRCKAAAAAVVLLLSLLAGCGTQPTDTAAPAPATAAAGSAAATPEPSGTTSPIGTAIGGAAGNQFVVPAPPPAQRAICLDSTASTNISFAESIRSEIADAVAAYLPPRPANTLTGGQGSAALTIMIHLVTPAPFGFSQPHLHLQVPAVDGYHAQPDLHSADAVAPNGPYFQWRNAQSGYRAERSSAEAAVSQAVHQISAFNLHLPPGPAGVPGSAVRTCMSVLAVSLLPGTNKSVAIASDLEDNIAPQTEGDFGGAPVHTIQPCPSGNGTHCQKLWSGFKTWLASVHGIPLPPVVPENSAAAITAWMQGQ